MEVDMAAVGVIAGKRAYQTDKKFSNGLCLFLSSVCRNFLDTGVSMVKIFERCFTETNIPTG